jgi:hypothetical protein
MEDPRDHPGRPRDANADIANTNSPSAISRSKLRVGARPKCTYISCVLGGYKLIRTQQVVISKLNPIQEDTTANHFRPTTTRIPQRFSKPHPVSKHDPPQSLTHTRHPLPSAPSITATATATAIASSTPSLCDHTYHTTKAMRRQRVGMLRALATYIS